MPEELIYTSAPRGLKPGSSGFCTVAATPGLASGPVAARLEQLSGYAPLFPVGHPSAGENPVRFAHVHLGGPGRGRSVLSRVAFAGADHTGRTNKIAHHLLLDASERVPAGPAWLLMQPAVFQDTWSGDPQRLTTQSLPIAETAPEPAATWQRLAGDAGWAGVVAETLLNDRAATAHVLHDGNTDSLDLLRMAHEVIRLLPPARRWDITFSTYHTEQIAGADCRLRFCISGSPAAQVAQRSAAAGGVLVDLTSRSPAPDGVSSDAARKGLSLPLNAPPPATETPVERAGFISPPVSGVPGIPVARSASIVPVVVERGDDDLNAGDEADYDTPKPLRIAPALLAAVAVIPFAVGGILWLTHIPAADRNLTASGIDSGLDDGDSVADQDSVESIPSSRAKSIVAQGAQLPEFEAQQGTERQAAQDVVDHMSFFVPYFGLIRIQPYLATAAPLAASSKLHPYLQFPFEFPPASRPARTSDATGQEEGDPSERSAGKLAIGSGFGNSSDETQALPPTDDPAALGDSGASQLADQLPSGVVRTPHRLLARPLPLQDLRFAGASVDVKEQPGWEKGMVTDGSGKTLGAELTFVSDFQLASFFRDGVEPASELFPDSVLINLSVRILLIDDQLTFEVEPSTELADSGLLSDVSELHRYMEEKSKGIALADNYLSIHPSNSPAYEMHAGNKKLLVDTVKQDVNDKVKIIKRSQRREVLMKMLQSIDITLRDRSGAAIQRIIGPEA